MSAMTIGEKRDFGAGQLMRFSPRIRKRQIRNSKKPRYI